MLFYGSSETDSTQLPAHRSSLSVGGSYWPDIKYEPCELARQEPQPIRLRATPDQITRMEETLTWITWINQGERNLVWLRAYRTPWRVIARETGFPKTSAQRYWHGALLKIAARLEQERKSA